MKSSIYSLMTLILLGSVSTKVQAHCEDPIIYSLDTLSPGVVELQSCYTSNGLNICVLDTNTQAGLMDHFINLYGLRSNVIMSTVDSVHAVKVHDSIYFDEELFVNTFYLETVWISVDSVIKGDFLKKKLVIQDSLLYLEYHVNDSLVADSSTYKPLTGKQFLSFFNSVEYMRDLELYPTSNTCGPNAVGYFVEGENLTRQGNPGIPGISVKLETFLSSTGIKSFDKSPRFESWQVVKGSGYFEIILPEDLSHSQIYLVDVAGRILHQQHTRGSQSIRIENHFLRPGTFPVVRTLQGGFHRGPVLN